jgi:hypothetical protein
MNGISVPKKQGSREHVCSLGHVSTLKVLFMMNRPQPHIKSPRTLILGYSASRSVNIEFLLFINYPLKIIICYNSSNRLRWCPCLQNDYCLSRHPILIPGRKKGNGTETLPTDFVLKRDAILRHVCPYPVGQN